MRSLPARLAFILTVNLVLFANALAFEEDSGASLPLIPLVGLPFLLARRSEKVFLVAGAFVSVLLFGLYHAGVARFLSITPHEAPRWYFAANASAAFLCALLLPLVSSHSSQQTEREVERRGQERLARLIHSSIIGVGRGRLGGPLREANDALLSLLGYTREELEAGTLLLDLLTPPEYREATRTAIKILKERGTSPVYEKEYIRKDGTRIPVLIGMASLDAQTGDTIGFVLDMRAQKAAEHQRERLRESEEAIRTRDLFDSVVSHELKTPLAALTMQLEMVMRALEPLQGDKASCQMHVGRCKLSAKKLNSLIDTLLHSAKLQRGQVDLALERVDLADTARNVVNALEAGGLCPAGLIHLEAPEPVVGNWDPLRLDEVLTNLCSNAVKYGGGQPVELRITGDHGRHARIEVIDRGIGIDRAMLAKIFEPFQRAVLDKRYQGLGLGLHIARSIIECHGGTIAVESEHGRGSRFVVELPREPPPHA